MFTKSYIKQNKTYVGDGPVTLLDCLKKHARSLKDQEAFIFASYSGNREVVTWNELLNKSTSVAKSLIQLGVKPGEVVAINLRTCPEWLYVAFGTMLAGACAASISFTYKDGSDLVASMEKIANCSMLVMDPGVDNSNWNIVKPLLDEFSVDGTASSNKMQYLRYFIGFEKAGSDKIMDGVKPLHDLINTTHPDIALPEVTEDTLAVLLQTSGSTGVPKIISVAYRNINFIFQTSNESAGDIVNPDSVMFNDRPFSWAGGFPFSVMVGQKRVTIDGFEPEPIDKIAFIMDLIAKEKCHCVMALPPMLHALIEQKDSLPENWSVQMIFTGGQPITKNLAASIGTLGKSLVLGYGGSEFSVAAVGFVSSLCDFKEYWAGKLVEGPAFEVKIVDDNGEIVPVNTRGEVYIKSEGVFKGYYNDPEKTASVKTADGWYKTDDIGSMTEDGEFYVYGRKSNLIISGGMNVAPEILEHSIKQCPGIEDVVIVPLPDEVYYQVICACLFREKGSDATEQQVRAFCEDIHNDKPKLFTVLPKYYVFLDTIPETTSGKISRPALRKMVEKMFIK